MLHLLDQVRPPIDAFERTLIDVFSQLPSVQAIWIREVRDVTPQLRPDGTPKRYTRAVWLQFARRSRTDLEKADALARELQVRVIAEPFSLEVRVVVDDLPPAAIAPSCIFKRGSGRV